MDLSREEPFKPSLPIHQIQKETMTTTSSIGFHAVPDSPHLTWSWCGYTLLTLDGLDEDLTSDQVSGIYINGVKHMFRVLLPRTVMLIPAFKQEAQRVRIEIKREGQEVASEIKSVLSRSPRPPPDESYGLTKPQTSRRPAP